MDDSLASTVIGKIMSHSRIIVGMFLMLVALTSCGTDPKTSLLAAAKKGDTAKVKALIAGGTDVNTADDFNMTTLMTAAREGHPDTVQALLDNGAHVNATGGDGMTALMIASFGGHQRSLSSTVTPKTIP